MAGRKRLASFGASFHVGGMNFPQYWALGRSGGFSCWRSSAHSQAEAQTLANQAAQQLAERYRAGNFANAGGSGGGYYPNRPLRELVLQEVKNNTGELSAVVTRNSYGCLVLNTAQVMFVDIDLPEPKRPGLFQRLFGKPAPAAPANTPESALAKIEGWTRQHPEWGWRIYRTRAGLRLLAMQGLVAADSEATRGVFQALGADPLYQKLCQTQNCFRARLTPKPWRCGLNEKPERWPWRDGRAEKQFDQWAARYQTNSAAWATCEFLRHTGNPAVHPEVQALLKLHDDATRADSKLPLA
jgi:hypothetical protein